MPARGYKPALWMLGSSTYGATAAAVLGMPYSFAYHFAPAMLDDALAAYRQCVPTVAGARRALRDARRQRDLRRDRRARAIGSRSPAQLAFLRLRQGRPDVYPSADEAAEYNFTPLERQFVEDWTRSHVIGDVATVRAGLEALVERTGADELMVVDDGAEPRRAGGVVHAAGRRLLAQRHPLTGRAVAHSDHSMNTRQIAAMRVCEMCGPVRTGRGPASAPAGATPARAAT